MDSSVTLVNPVPPTPYFLSNTTLKDAVIYAHPAIPLYKVTSDSKQIRISDGSTSGRTIAVLHRRELLPNTVSFTERKGRSQFSVQKWLRKTKLPGGFSGYIMQTSFGPYIWKSVSRHRQKVYANHDPNTHIASFYLHQTLSHGTPAFVLESGAEPLRDDLVVAYLIQRHRIMMEDRALNLFAGLPTN
ncbi:hypothetical protein PAXINDRAFT_122318 [Paxillus involutus ATCC 200175]|uniref:DUF6593 domain-containing protein n=1 Tax=Paxillus involutus ATCC 200175 TaxID=664439 RepID=A0A0C9T1B0_PAXIN|nr:hypothetical protein PAXINDRAFT_122318 [Paxillus involutus ATCC 200175]